MSAERNCPRKTFKSIRRTVWKTQKKDPKNDPKRAWKTFSPSQAALKYFTGTFQQILKVFHRPKFGQKKVFFHREALQGGPRQ